MNNLFVLRILVVSILFSEDFLKKEVAKWFKKSIDFGKNLGQVLSFYGKPLYFLIKTLIHLPK